MCPVCARVSRVCPGSPRCLFNVRFVWGAFVSCWFACGCVLELAVCRVRFARVSCPRLRFAGLFTGAPTAVDILASFPPVRGLVFGSTACGGVQRGARRLGVLLAPCVPGCVVVSPASVALAWRPLHARRTVLHDLDAALPGRLRRGRCACPPPPISRLELIGGSGPLAAPPAATRLPRAPSFRRPPSSRRGEALWERVEAGSGSLGAASSESTAGSGQVGSNWVGAVGCSAPALRLLSRPRFRPSR